MSVFQISTTGVVNPKVLTTITAPSKYTKALGERERNASLETTETYYRSLTPISSNSSVGQLWRHKRMGQDVMVEQIKNPHYLIQADYKFDIRKASLFDKTMSANGVSFLQTNQNLLMQSIAQNFRNICWFGAGAGEGLLNGVTDFDWGTEPGGANNLEAYSASFVREKILESVRLILDATYNQVDEIVIFSSNRVMNLIATQIQVLNESQKDGGGIDTTTGLVKRVLEDAFRDLNLKVSIYIEPRFEGMGGDATKDKFVVIAPRLNQQSGLDEWERKMNLVGEENSMDYNTTMDFGSGITLVPINTNPNTPQGEGYAVVSSGITLRKECVISTNLKVK